MLVEKLEKRREMVTSCQPLVDALLAGILSRFRSVLGDKQAVAATILLPDFKTDWPMDQASIDIGNNSYREQLYTVVILCNV